MPKVVSYFTGLDLGQSRDFSALAILECTREVPEKEGIRVIRSGAYGKTIETSASPLLPPPAIKPLNPSGAAIARLGHYAIRALTRYDLGTPYTTLVDLVSAKFSKPPLQGSTLTIDWTGVGQPVLDMFIRARPRCAIRPVKITGGSGFTAVGSGFHVAKKELVGILQVLLSCRKLQIAKALPHSATLVHEMENFKVKISTAGNESYESWRESDHDDLVLAVAMAAWVAEKGQQEFWIR